ncbi:putative F-box protein At3g17490 [Andrographis paniculata]|uniref:putative F-box protein At3g17490 n=1 Tax=Andrographis paniculata TaxID=175694 RepID=UPI0021E900FB|nr:putative F-box protein At3g17490 [Andrographis paniculata]
MADNKSKFVPDDVIFEILTWLPPETLIRLKTVCKLWNSTICDSKFISKHRSNFGDSRRNKNNIGRIIIPTTSIRFGSFNIHKTFVLPEHNLRATFENVEFVNDSEGPLSLTIYGSCNGVLCCMSGSNHLMVCNPCIGRSILIPNSPSRCFHFRGDFGIGYDSERNDYKIVNMTEKCLAHVSIAEVFSLKSNSWKEIESPVKEIGLPWRELFIVGMSIYISGFIHWLCTSLNKSKILRFDVANEVFSEMELPMEIDRWRYGVASIAEANGLLSLTVLKKYPDIFEVWTMNEYGVLGSWIRRFEGRVPHHSKIVSIGLTIECKIMMCLLSFRVTSSGFLRQYNNKWNREAKENILLAVVDLKTPNRVYSTRLLDYPYHRMLAFKASLELLDYVA